MGGSFLSVELMKNGNPKRPFSLIKKGNGQAKYAIRTSCLWESSQVVNYLDYAMETGTYTRNISRYESQMEVWADNNAKEYAIVIQHCPNKLKAKLKNQEAWGRVNEQRSVAGLLVLIWDLQYNKTNRKRSSMATVEAEFNL
jgi:hypothetical protein